MDSFDLRILINHRKFGVIVIVDYMIIRELSGSFKLYSYCNSVILLAFQMRPSSLGHRNSSALSGLFFNNV